MKICVISTNIMTCPPSGYSGLEMLAWQQAIGLSENHEVTFVAPEGSVVPPHINLIPTKLGELEQSSFQNYMQLLHNFDCIIDHSWQKWSIMGKFKCPILLWLHAPVDTMFKTKPPIDKPCFVAISEDQANHVKTTLNCHAEVCYNGVDINFYKPISKPRNNHYLFLARFSTIKGPDIAVSIAKKCNINLDLVGDDQITGELPLSTYIKTQCNLNHNLRYIGPQTREQCRLWFNTNEALIHPVLRYREPFGLAPVEAQACGMPVIAWNNGAMRETIEHGKTGFLVNSETEIEDLINTKAIDDIDRSDCIKQAHKFSYENMIKRVEELCKKSLKERW